MMKIERHRFHLGTVAACAAALGMGIAAATPARADHDGGPSFHFSFGFPVPPPPVVLYGPPPIYYYDPGPRVVIQNRPYYRDWHYAERGHPDWQWRNHHHFARPHGRHERD